MEDLTEVERLTRACGVVDRALAASHAQVAALTAENEALRAALEKIRCWDVPGEPGSVDERNAIRRLARAALEAT